MKKVVVLMVSLFTCSLAFGQDIDKAFKYFGNEQYGLAAKEFESCLPELRSYYGKNDTTVYSNYIFYTATSYFFYQQYDKAEKYFIQGKEIFERINGQANPFYFSFLNGLIELYYKKGELNQAILMMKVVLQKFETNLGKDLSYYEMILVNYGALYLKLMQFGEASSYYIEANEIIKNVFTKDDPAYLETLETIAFIYHEFGSYDKSLPLLIETVEILEMQAGKEHPDYLSSLNNLAMSYYEMGRYEKALPLFLEAIEIMDNVNSKDSAGYATTLNNLAELYAKMNQYNKALPLSKEALEIRERILGKDHPDYATSLNNLALIYDMVGEYDKIMPLLIESLEITERSVGKEHIYYSITLGNLADILKDIGKYENAKPMYLEILEITEKTVGRHHPYYARYLNNLAGLYLDLGEYELALNLFSESLEIIKMAFGKEHHLYATALCNLAGLHFKMEHFDKVFHLLQQATETSLSNISQNFTFLSEGEKNQYFNTISHAFLLQLSFFYTYSPENPSVGADAWNLELVTKGMILQSGIQMRQAILNSGDEEALKKYDDWMVAKASLAKQYSLPIAQRSENLRDMELQSEKLESELNRLSNTFKQALSIGSIKWQDVQQKLGENEVAIEFSSFPYYNGKQWTDSIFYTANVLRPGDEHPHLVYLCEQRQLDSLLYRPGNTEPGFIAGLYRGAELIETSMPSNGQRLYELIWKPIAHLLPAGATVYFAPSGSLHQIAHAAIPVDENNLLSDKYKLVQLSTTAALLQDDDQNETLTGEIALFGGIQYDMNEEELLTMSSQNQDFNKIIMQRGIPADFERSAESWSYLPGTLAEVETIGKLASAQGKGVISYTGKEALEDRFKALSGNNSPAILHIATHGFFFPDPKKELKNENFMLIGEKQQVFRASDNPLNRAGLLFAGANHAWRGDTVPEGVDDGILTAWEATNITLANTQLVALSACETGLGEVRGSEGVFGLQRAFKAAGAQYLLMSLWKVPDQETAEFMAYFYARVFEGSSITDAFHDTQHHMKTQYPAEPYKWAAFVLLK